MRFVEQTTFGAPGGNCVAACLASVLELDLEHVPDLRPEGIVARFGRPPDGVDAQDWAIGEWLRPLDFTVTTYAPGFPLPWEEWHHWQPDLSGLVLAAGWSQRHEGHSHQVVLLDGSLYWDPHPQRAMGVGPIWGFTIIEHRGRRLRP